jgi:hypothetical protein
MSQVSGGVKMFRSLVSSSQFLELFTTRKLTVPGAGGSRNSSSVETESGPFLKGRSR